jgi:chemotaxis receptor (MCP) glutamine deamidase CheD
MDDSWPVKGKFDAIFCRNVMIYFDRETQRRLLSRFATMLEPDGIVVLGHSESLYWMTDTFASVGNTIYRARAYEDSPRETQTTAIAKPPRLEPKTVPEIAKPAAKPIPNPMPVARTPSALPAAKGKSDGPEYAIILGEVQTTVGPAVIKTLLGSCVSACIYDPATGIGGMNHFSLPGVADGGTCARYGAYAMELLITAIMKKGGDRSRLRAKVFGGAKVLKIEAESMNVGAKNAAFVLQYLEDEGIPVEAQCLGGTRGLLVRFHPNTGKAQAKPLVERDLSPVIERERKFGRELLQKVESPAGDAFTLF